MSSTRILKLACFKDAIQEKAIFLDHFAKLLLIFVFQAGPLSILSEVNGFAFQMAPLCSRKIALNKLEKVALRSARRTGRPLVLIINNVHFFKNDDEGRNVILQLQQKAEAWAASGQLHFSQIAFSP